MICLLASVVALALVTPPPFAPRLVVSGRPRLATPIVLAQKDSGNGLIDFVTSAIAQTIFAAETVTGQTIVAADTKEDNSDKPLIPEEEATPQPVNFDEPVPEDEATAQPVVQQAVKVAEAEAAEIATAEEAKPVQGATAAEAAELRWTVSTDDSLTAAVEKAKAAEPKVAEERATHGAARMESVVVPAYMAKYIGNKAK